MISKVKVLLVAGVAMPFLYYGALIVGSLFYPGYSHVTQYASELGSAQAAHPAIFNGGILLMGLAGVPAAFGFYGAVAILTRRRMLGALVALTVGLFGVSMVLGGLFPMPDPRHGGYGLGLGIHAAPALLAAALWPRRDLRALQRFLLIVTLVMAAFFAIMMGVGQLVTRANVGIFQRLYSLALFPWIGIAAAVLRSKLGEPREADPAG